MPDIAIIIPTPDAELIVRDDAGVSAARNAGIREATADKLVFLDDDSVPRGDYFGRVSALLDEHEAVTDRIRDTGAWYIRPVSSSDYDQGESGHVTETVVGCDMALRREVIDDIGGFDERLPYGHQETELVDRLCERYDVWDSPDLVVDHPFADSPGGYLERQYRHGREAIPYYRIRDENVHRRMARFAPVPSHSPARRRRRRRSERSASSWPSSERSVATSATASGVAGMARSTAPRTRAPDAEPRRLLPESAGPGVGIYRSIATPFRPSGAICSRALTTTREATGCQQFAFDTVFSHSGYLLFFAGNGHDGLGLQPANSVSRYRPATGRSPDTSGRFAGSP